MTTGQQRQRGSDAPVNRRPPRLPAATRGWGARAQPPPQPQREADSSSRPPGLHPARASQSACGAWSPSCCVYHGGARLGQARGKEVPRGDVFGAHEAND